MYDDTDYLSLTVALCKQRSDDVISRESSVTLYFVTPLYACCNPIIKSIRHIGIKIKWFCAPKQRLNISILVNLPLIYNVYFPQELSIKIMILSTQLPHTILSSFEKFSGAHSIFRSVFYPANFFVLISLFVVPFFLQCLSPNIHSSALHFCLF